jgi:lysophospholipase L1-like esterase
MIAVQKPKFVLMMIGINDRKQIREAAQATGGSRNAKPPAQPADDEAADKPREAPDGAARDLTQGGHGTLEFRSDAWSESYIRRIDETIASLKTSGVPVFWVGLPPVRGPKSAADIPFLNDLYRSRADKAGIIYIDVWEGFVDEDGHYAQSGPDVEGQTRRLRTGDDVYFTQAGARKLAHYVEREIQRWLNTRSAPIAKAIAEEPKAERAARAGQGGQSSSHARPLAGPVVPLVAERGGESDELLGDSARQPSTDALVAKVMARGESIPAPAGRADDFTWPRRGVAPVGSDPVVAMTDLPMTPMVADRGSTTTGAAAPSSRDVASAAPAKPSPPRHTVRRSPAYAEAQGMYRPDYYRRPQSMFQPFGFQPLFGGGRW